MPDPVGNVNNWLFVRKPENTPVPTSSLSSQLQQQQPSTRTPGMYTSGQAGILDIQASDLSKLPVPVPPTNVEVNNSLISQAQVDEPAFTRQKFLEFLSHHTAYELIPESGKVVVLDIDLPLRQAFHALYEQGITSSPLFDSVSGKIVGVISASDLIETLQRLRSLVSSSANPMSESEMDQHTIRGLREQLAAEGRERRNLVSLSPADSLANVVKTLFDKHCSMAPILTVDDTDSESNFEGVQVLSNATLGGILACLMRHFRASIASLPLLARPLSSLPIGTWSPSSQVVGQNSNEKLEGKVRRERRKVEVIKTVTKAMLLTDAMEMILDSGVSSIPVLEETGAVCDIFARADVTSLAKGNAYSRLQFEDFTVGQALSLAAGGPRPPQLLPVGGTSPSSSMSSLQENSTGGQAPQRLWVCSPDEPLCGVLERLALPGVRRVVVAHPETKHVEGIVSLSDIAAYLLM